MLWVANRTVFDASDPILGYENESMLHLPETNYNGSVITHTPEHKSGHQNRSIQLLACIQVLTLTRK